MKKTTASLIFTLLISVLFADAQSISVNTYSIPSGGGTKTVTPLPAQIKVTTNGAVTLAGNYTMQYSSLPAVGTMWKVYCDFSQLNLNGNTVSIFGAQPLVAYPQTDTFYILFWVDYNVSGTPVLNRLYCSSLVELKNVSNSVNFNGRVNFNDTVALYGLKTYLKPVTSITANQTVIVTDTAGKLGFGCAPWCVTGNSALSPSANFLGTTDTVPLRFRVNNVASGIIDYNLGNTALGYQTLLANTIGTGNLAIGYRSLYSNTSGSANTAIDGGLMSNTIGNNNVSIGGNSMLFSVSGDNNVAVGHGSLPANTTGHDNTAIGYNTLATNTIGNYNIALGANVNASSSSVTKSIGIGYGAILTSNQLAIAGIRSISIPQMTSALNYILTDTSGTGDFVPRVNPTLGQTTFTPLTGDSLTITTSQNDINPAGTLAVLTIILPASPVSGFVYEFSTTQVLTSLLWSVRLSGGTTTGLPSTLAQYGTVKIKWNSALSRWLNY